MSTIIEKNPRSTAIYVLYIAILVAIIAVCINVSIGYYPEESSAPYTPKIITPKPIAKPQIPEAKPEIVATTTAKVTPPKTPKPAPQEPKVTKPSKIITAYSGPSTLAVSSIPLLSGGVAKPGKSVPISYLQITNTGSDTVTLKGFWVKQNGTAPTQAIIGLTTIDDKGGSQGATPNIEGSTPFQNGSAFAPTNATFAPGELKLFTIKAVLSNNLSLYIGTDITLSVSSLNASSPVQGMFPIQGTTWTIEN